MNSCKIAYIYGLYEIGKDDIRYIGKTNNPNKRLRDHKNDKKYSYKSCWIKSVISNGGNIGLRIIKIVDHKKWKKYEIQIIQEMRSKYDLVNLTDGGDGRMTNIYNKNFIECKNWIISNKPIWVNTMKQYKIWSKMLDFPKFLPKAPNRVFNDWTSWGDYLGSGNIHTMNRKDIYLTYDEAKKYLKDNFNLKNSVEFRNTKIPIFIPKKPFNIYDCWKGWDDFLDYKPVRIINGEYLNYEDAKIWISNNFSNIVTSEYREKSKNNELPIFLPKKPERVYENFNWGEFLATNGRRKSKSFYLSYDESIRIVHTFNIKTNAEWRKWCKNKPKEFIRIPSSPSTVYKKEWENWFKWLGN